ncbi:E3 ubiquitin-protein ligase RNF19A [Leptonychotes weddellii]|uniref:RBR-type E3 ubiquitin transferase n=1 Tax=Leptonychotes weddellii TaxID=9713 RepID=A0A7F8RCK5_LEPWE|nr:E3 ubiquitin-protein ligase RNF19A [Leptonychotes weddellii]
MQEREIGFISKYNEGLCVNTDPDSILMSILDMSLHRQMGSDRDLQSSASSVSLPSVKKAPKKRRISIGSLFRRKKDNKRKSRELNGGVDGIASIESIHSEMCTDKNSIFSTNTSSDNGLTSISKQIGDFIECPLCLLRHSKDRFPEIMTCHHRSCVDCLRQYLRIEISESRVNISCPECTERFNPHDIRLILSDDVLMEKYEEFMLRRWLVADPDCRWCPAPDCGYAVIAFGCASCPKLTCGREGCGTEFCYHCKQIWHPNQTCDAARQERAQSLRLRTIRSSSISYSQESGAAADDIKPCPRCAAYIIKMNDGSCNHMTCAVCGCEFCWLCMKEISDLHYLSPSGCTFWGKKPWSRKKKILWQLGTLVGAPVGIALIAGIAIPAMIIGIPVYVGRKIHNRYEGKDVSKHKRNLAITGGVTLSVIVSPVVAAVTVGIGVPIMLAYVYGVVPISLCRSGGCGVSAGNGKGVRIEFDDENDINVGGTNTAVGKSFKQRKKMYLLIKFLSLCCYLNKDKRRLEMYLYLLLSCSREGSSMEVQVDIESKPSKFRHNSGSSSVEDGSATRSHPGGSCSGLPEGKSGATKWSKEATAGKKAKSGKLRKKSNMKINETREDMDAQLLEQQSTNSSEFEAPSLSDSMPSVADSHSSHFSEFSCSDLESMKTSCSHGSNDYHARFATVNILPEVENDRLENSPHQCSISVLTKTASCSEVPQLNHIAEEHGNNGIKPNVDLYFGDALKETNNNHSHQTMELKVAIQTEI